MSVNIFNKSTGSITQIAGNATGGGGTTVAVDNILSTTSENPVQNKVITEELNKKADQTTVDSALSLKANSADVTASLAEKSDIGHTHDDRYYTETEIDTKLSEKIDSSIKGVANGIAELDSNGKVLTAQLPSYVDDVLEYSGISDFPTVGETGKIYVDTTTNKTYRWSGSTYIEISESIALGETSSTAYRGDRGKIAYDHSQTVHAPSNAEANVQSDWNETDTTSDAYIKNKPTSLPANGGNSDTANGLVYHELGLGTNYTMTASDFSKPGIYGIGSLASGSPNVLDEDGFNVGDFKVLALNNNPTYQMVIMTSPRYIDNRAYIGRFWDNKFIGWKRISDGGNADTLNGLHANEIASNPNLLINPDFAVNQRGSTSYSSAGYTVDDWLLYISGSGNSGSYDAKTHVLSGSVLDTDGYYVNLFQYIENPERFAGKVMTLSASMSELNKPALIQVWRTEGTTITGVAATSYNLEPDKVLTFTMPSDLTETSKIRMVLQTRGSVKPNWAKLEIGGIATPFVPPEPVTELAKCQRYYQIRSAGDIDPVDLRPTMRTTPTVTQLSDGNYAYSAEL